MKRSVTPFVVLGLVAGCTTLTKVDWSRIPAPESAGGATVAGGGGGTTGGTAPTDGGAAGALGLAGAESGGQSDGGYGSDVSVGGSDSAGISGSGGGGGGGGGGFAGSGGTGGSGGSGGSGASGGSGGNSAVAPKCSTYPKPPANIDLTGKIVMFDGGAQPAGVDWGGRDGLDAKCQAAAGPLGLSKSVIHAFISTDTNDVLTPGDMANYVEKFAVPTNPAVVSPLGIKIASSASELTNWQLSLICAGVVHEDVTAWLTGVKDGGNYDTTLNCAGWTLRKEDLNVRASVGLTDTTNSLFHDHLLADHWVSCSNSTAHVLCLGWDAP